MALTNPKIKEVKENATKPECLSLGTVLCSRLFHGYVKVTRSCPTPCDPMYSTVCGSLTYSSASFYIFLNC